MEDILKKRKPAKSKDSLQGASTYYESASWYFYLTYF